jgi:hypothetical protein
MVSYGRSLPLTQVQQAFPTAPDLARVQGATDLQSTSRFQRIARRWQYLNQYWSGSSVLTTRYPEDDPVVAIVCRETAPGVDPEWPEGRLEIVAYENNSSTSGSGGSGTKHSSTDRAVLLHVGPLPGGRISCIPFYAKDRMDDPYGKPFVADLSPLQQQLNQIISMRAERLKRYSMPQLMAKTGGIEEDTSVADPDSIMFVNSQEYPAFLNPPMGNPDYNDMLNEIQQQMFRIGGWQAASRGEGKAGDAASKVVALARADDTVFGPIVRSFKRSFINLMCTSHNLYRQYTTSPILLQSTGDEISFLRDPWISGNDMGAKPVFEVTNGFGSTPETVAQSLSNLVVMRGADGKPLMTTEEFWDKYPDASMKPFRPNVAGTKERRQKAIKNMIEQLCQQSAAEYGEEIKAQPQMMQVLMQSIHGYVLQTYPVLRTDSPEYCINALDELVHDPSVLPLTRMVAEMRQAIYFQWMMSMATPNIATKSEQPAQQGPAGAPPGQGPTGTPAQGNPFGMSQGSQQVN